jgi:hypothetical protein
MPAYEIPLTGNAQKLNISLGANNYWLTFVWNTNSGNWNLDIADTNQAPLAQGLPVITGLDLLKQYAHLGIPGSLVVQTDSSPDVVPTYDNLGTDGHVYFVTAS